ncbi:MAG TPA: ATP synthase delta/epsilon chain alpha-helix domain-containing protein [Candidatus Acidoferrum sp.]|nr:ATP synthase delta/epsilon chain alpha-helix domain-containing protein [Candidatus Acidoferrum sp.]
MAELIQLVIVTPERQLLSHPVMSVTLPGADGELGILPGHAPLITELGIGELSYQAEAEPVRQGAAGAAEKKYPFEDFVPHVTIIRGFAEVLPGRVTVLAETAERAEEIDVERAKRALERAEERIAAGPVTQDIDWDRATGSLQRAMVRLKVAEYAPRKRSVTVPGQ